MRRAAGLLAALFALIWAAPALAWGAQGHRAIADVAWANMQPSTRAAIRDLLLAAPALDTPECRMAKFRDAAVWPDCIRREGRRWAFTAPWHYQNGPVCAADFVASRNCPGGACVTTMILAQRAILANRAKPQWERLAALAFVAHFVGDVHQPFHAADAGDRGGNSELLSNAGMLGGDEDTTLHALWDTLLVRRTLAGGVWLDRTYSPAERAALGAGTPADWARESWHIAVATGYPQVLGHRACGAPMPANVAISPGAVQADVPLVRDRLTRAGLRLARMLDATLG